MKKVLIVGAGQAGFSVADALRKRNDSKFDIVMMGQEEGAPYQRPPLSKAYLAGHEALDKLVLRDPQWYGEHGIELKCGLRALKINREQKFVLDDVGRHWPYDALVLSTGSRARQLPEQIGGGLRGVYTLRSLADADALARVLRGHHRLLVVGGGYIGLEVAATARQLGVEQVTVIEAGPRILGRVACEETAAVIRQLHLQHGVDVREATAVQHLEGTSAGVARAVFDGGERLDVNVVLVGIGGEPEVELARLAGLELDNGIAVDEYGRTSDENIFACGDCASFHWRGARIRLESVQNAVDQGALVAANINGENRRYDPVPWFWSDQYDTTLQIVGVGSGHDRVVRRKGEREGGQSFWYFAGERWLATDVLNDPKTYVMAKRLLEKGMPISPAQAADSSLSLKSLLQPA